MTDRLVHHAEVISLSGDRYRLEDRDLGRVPRLPRPTTNTSMGRVDLDSAGFDSVADLRFYSTGDVMVTAAASTGRTRPLAVVGGSLSWTRRTPMSRTVFEAPGQAGCLEVLVEQYPERVVDSATPWQLS
jgi:hypothetical protein